MKDAMKDSFVERHLLGPEPRLPFSFVYDGRPLPGPPAPWPRQLRHEPCGAGRACHTLTWTDPRTALEVRCVIVDDADWPVVEWTVYLTNRGQEPTPLLEQIQGLDTLVEAGAADDVVLHGIKGDFCAAASFAPYRLPLGPTVAARFSPPAGSGKSTDGPDGWPYHNLQYPGGGLILAVGWPGQWETCFARDPVGPVRIRAGQQLTRLRLMPGETVRTPLIALLFWQGEDVVDAQNQWRRWYVARNMPRVDGRTQPAVTQIQVGGGEGDIAYVQSFLDADIHVDLCWRDAGGSAEATWFPAGAGPYQEPGAAWLNSGTWALDAAKYPRGFRPFTDWIHARGMQFVLWFEPERVGDPESWLGRNHPEWLLPGTSHGALLDEGNPQARQWLTDLVSGMIDAQGIDWYREDMNGGGPLPAWRRHDTPDRQGMTENLYVQGHLAYWDELRRRHPRLRIDSCASGGRRNDLETMRRAVPLLRSDFQFPGMPGVVEGNQGHTYGLSCWFPFQGTGTYGYDPYTYRSFFLPSFGMGGLDAANQAAQRQAYRECRQVAPRMLGDYYPLTPYSLDLDRWIAWQFDRPQTGDGVVQAFRRADCAADCLTCRLRGLDPSATYAVRDLDGTIASRCEGRRLLAEGLVVRAAERPHAVVVLYERTD